MNHNIIKKIQYYIGYNKWKNNICNVNKNIGVGYINDPYIRDRCRKCNQLKKFFINSKANEIINEETNLNHYTCTNHLLGKMINPKVFIYCYYCYVK